MKFVDNFYNREKTQNEFIRIKYVQTNLIEEVSDYEIEDSLQETAVGYKY